MAAEVVEEEAIFIALFLLVMGVHVAPWERRKGARLASLVEVGLPRQGASAQCGRGALAGGIREPPHHRPPCSCPGHWLYGRLSPVGPEAHPGPSGWSTHADPRGRAQWSSPAQRTYQEGQRRGSGQEGLLFLLWARKSCLISQGETGVMGFIPHLPPGGQDPGPAHPWVLCII